jgi:hypothetical protein
VEDDMSLRIRPVHAAVSAATLLVAAAAISAACGGGNPRGSCVTYYTDGDVSRYTTDKAYCEETCAERQASSTLIASCFFEGSRQAPVEP